MLMFIHFMTVYGKEGVFLLNENDMQSASTLNSFTQNDNSELEIGCLTSIHVSFEDM